MTQKASQEPSDRGAALRGRDGASGEAVPNATPHRHRDVLDQTVEQSVNWTAETIAHTSILTHLTDELRPTHHRRLNGSTMSDNGTYEYPWDDEITQLCSDNPSTR